MELTVFTTSDFLQYVAMCCVDNWYQEVIKLPSLIGPNCAKSYIVSSNLDHY